MKKLKLPKIGAAFEGGFFAGTFFIGDQAYALIVSPKKEGDLGPIEWVTISQNQDRGIPRLVSAEPDGIASGL